MLSLGVPGVEPLHSSRAISARSSFTAQQQEKAFGALVDNSKTSRPSASFTSEEHVFRVANIGPGQLLGEECFSDKKIIQFSVVSDSFATVLSVPFDTLAPMLSKERFSALSTMCLNTLALRAQRAVSGCSWYQSRRMESQRFKLTTKPIEILRSGTTLIWLPVHQHTQSTLIQRDIKLYKSSSWFVFYLRQKILQSLHKFQMSIIQSALILDYPTTLCPKLMLNLQHHETNQPIPKLSMVWNNHSNRLDPGHLIVII
jgi:hypothetical protein